jgi:hypothetical protein
MGTLLIVGTQKGAFLLRSDGRREAWRVEGPLYKGWKVTAAARDEAGRTWVATASDVYGVALHVGRGASSFQQIERGPGFAADEPARLVQVWTIVPPSRNHPRAYCGVADAGLFRSDDDGSTWQPVEGLNRHPTREAWQPGAGGLCAHVVMTDPRDSRRAWCGISAVGVFRTDDAGVTWAPKNRGLPIVIEDKQHKDVGTCVHALQQDPHDPDTIYQQNHMGMFRTRDGGESWHRIEAGLPSRFGFPLALDRRRPALFCVPLESDEYRMPLGGRLRVYRSLDRGDSWQPLERGLPEVAYTGVLRHSLTTDGLDPCGIYVGTTSGTVHASVDGGESWRDLPGTFPRILHLSAWVE